LTCVLGGAVVAEGKNRDAQISQVELDVRLHLILQVIVGQSIINVSISIFILLALRKMNLTEPPLFYKMRLQ